MTPELCRECDAETGRAGRADDSMYIGDEGPFCSDCYRDRECGLCFGEGSVNVLRNDSGEVDYLTGRPSGETVYCTWCDGEGHI